MLGLGYPGGGVISKLARKGDPKKIHFPRSYLGKSSFDFSFSGLKTAVNRYIKEHSQDLPDGMVDIAAGFQEAVVEVLVNKLVDAALSKGCNRIALVGGVAANDRLRSVLRADADRKGLSVHIPSLSLCGDNAAMIAATGYHFIKEGYRSKITEDAYSRQPIKLVSKAKG